MTAGFVPPQLALAMVHHLTFEAALITSVVSLIFSIISLEGCGGGGSSPPPAPPSPEKVQVEFWVESGSPKSQLFVFGPLKKAVASPGIENIMNVSMYSFGNAYYETEKDICGTPDIKDYSWGPWPNGYNDSYRDCWDKQCGRGSTEPLAPGAGCFVSGPYCQNGASGCTVNLLQMCAKRYQPSFLEYVPFALCMETNYRSILGSVKSGTTPNMSFLTSVVKQCVKDTQLDASQVLDCFDTDVYHTVMKDTAMQTVDHTQTPWVLITNKTGAPMVFTGDFTDNDFLLKVVCKAWEFNGGDMALVKDCSTENTQIAV
mmetsp:Transcript_63908/g.111349  ORF Transcript_63908/g.111349 Transcript_63908/m.111349 type:complete len:316 (-) Transcript_63908:38-985(-)